MGISDRLKELRKQKRLTQKELAERLGIPLRSIINYENSQREPNAKAMAALEQFFNVSGGYLRGETDEPFFQWEDREIMEHVHDALSRLASVVIETARSSDECSKKMVYDILVELRHVISLEPPKNPAAMMLLQETFGITTRFIDSCLFAALRETPVSKKIKKERIQDFIAALNSFELGNQSSSGALLPEDFEIDLSDDKKEIAVFLQPAAAGTGTFLDSDEYDMVDVPINPITIRATFGVRISGDSMTPDYEDEDIVFVKQQPTVDHGELGVFILNGDAYFKRLLKKGKTTYLESFNEKYKPIQVKPSDELRVVGRVIGKHND